MKSRKTAWLAWSACGLALVLIACSVVLAALNRFDLWSLDIILTEVAAALVGGLVASRRPGNLVGWFIIGHALCFTLGEFTRQYAIYGALTRPGSLPFARAMAWPPYWIWLPGLILLFSFLPLYFPNGTCPLAAGVRGSDETRSIPNPMSIEVASLGPFERVLDVVIPGAWLILAFASVASLVTRFARSRGEERQQIKCVRLRYVAPGLLQPRGRAVRERSPPSPSPWSGRYFREPVRRDSRRRAALPPLRHRRDRQPHARLRCPERVPHAGLFRRRALLQSAFRALTGQESNLVIVGSTLIIAALFSPLRRGVQSFIDRRFYRKKYDAARTLETFGARLRNETDLDELKVDVVSVIRETIHPSHVSLWLREPSGGSTGRGSA